MAEIVCSGGWWPPEGQAPDGWDFAAAELVLTLSRDDGVIDVRLNDGEGFDATALCSIPVVAVSSLLAPYVAVDARLAMAFACPHCGADPGEACWNDTGSEKVDLHAGRIAALDSDSDLSRYGRDGAIETVGQ